MLTPQESLDANIISLSPLEQQECFTHRPNGHDAVKVVNVHVDKHSEEAS